MRNRQGGLPVAKKSGLFAEMQHQVQLAEKRRVRQQNAANRALRQAEQAQRQAERAEALAATASAADQKKAQQEAARLRQEAIDADIAARNAQLADEYEEMDSMLAVSLGVDDYVDLEGLRASVEHPAFPHPELMWPTPQLATLNVRAEPVYAEPPAQSGLGGLLGRKKHADAVAHAISLHQADRAAWQGEVAAAEPHFGEAGLGGRSRVQAHHGPGR